MICKSTKMKVQKWKPLFKMYLLSMIKGPSAVLLETQVFWGVASHRFKMVTKCFPGAVILSNNGNYLLVNML
jgi:hypothetical protein